MATAGFWDNQDKASEVIAESNRLKNWVKPWHDLNTKVSELTEIRDLLEHEDDEDLTHELISEVDKIEGPIEDLELRTMLQGPDDHRGAILTVHPGAGGLESQDWAEMLTRMYSRWAENLSLIHI